MIFLRVLYLLVAWYLFIGLLHWAIPFLFKGRVRAYGGLYRQGRHSKAILYGILTVMVLWPWTYKYKIKNAVEEDTNNGEAT